MLENRIEDFLKEKFSEDDFLDLFVIEISLTKGKHLEVVLDSDTGLSLGTCQKISRFIENKIEEHGLIGSEDYTIDVTSPGTARPLIYPRQYKKHLGRTFEIMKNGQDNVEVGKLKEVTDTMITLEQNTVRKEGKKNIKEVIEIQFAFADIKKALVIPSFK
jgi:ribosome maturation factor RimP